MTDPAVQVRALSVRYGHQTVLHDIDLDVAQGSITAVVGPSGCGKTTLLRAIAGLEPVESGTVIVGGTTVAAPGRHVPAERRRVGLVPQEGALFEHLTVAGNVGFGLGPWWRPNPRRSGRVHELLTATGLSELAGRRPAQLSGGQQQRVALARALAPQPTVIGLDEPFSALDTALRTRLREHVKSALRAEGASALLVTHDAEEAMSMADQIVVLFDGRVRQVGTAREVYRSPVDSAVAGMFGDVTEIPADAAGDAADCAIGTVALRSRCTGPVTLLVRPDELTVEPGEGAEVVSSRYLGNRVALDVRVGSITARVDVPAEHAPAQGSSVTVRTAGPVHVVGRG